MSYLTKFVSKMGKGKSNRRIDEATSNSSLSNIRYVITEKPKWKVFKKREVVPIPAFNCRTGKGCPCGSSSPCKQKVTPKGVTIHYPQKKKKAFSSFSGKKRTPVKGGGLFNASPKAGAKVKTIKPKRFSTWRLDKISVKPLYGDKIITPRPYQSSSE